MARKKKAEAEEPVEGQIEEQNLEPVTASRRSVNTWWCDNCGSANRVGIPNRECGGCGRPLVEE